jgi:hypothetical protein
MLAKQKQDKSKIKARLYNEEDKENKEDNNPPEKSGGNKKTYTEDFNSFWKIYPHARK